MSESKELPKTVAATIFEKFRLFSKDILDTYGEPRSLVLVVDWELGQTDFAPGIIMTRAGISGLRLVSMCQQLNKMNNKLLNIVDLSAEDLAEYYDKLTKEVEELERGKQKLIASTTTGTADSGTN